MASRAYCPEGRSEDFHPTHLVKYIKHTRKCHKGNTVVLWQLDGIWVRHTDPLNTRAINTQLLYKGEERIRNKDLGRRCYYCSVNNTGISFRVFCWHKILYTKLLLQTSWKYVVLNPFIPLLLRNSQICHGGRREKASSSIWDAMVSFHKSSNNCNL